MAACCNKLWKLLIDRKMTKTQLCQAERQVQTLPQKWAETKMLGAMFFAEFAKLSIAAFEDIMGLIPFEKRRFE